MAKKVEHYYGPQVTIYNQTFLNGILAELCHPETMQPKINHLVELLYTHLLTEVMNEVFPKKSKQSPTRMTASQSGQLLKYESFDSEQKVISVNIARAGTYPSHICFDALHYAIEPAYLRQDHIFAARSTDGKNQVTGTEIGATKIGGDKENSIVLFPDPMGATGNTLLAALDYYKRQVSGTARALIALHLIVTPEYLQKVMTHHPDVLIFALRLDRGLSPEAVLSTAPGKYWEQEKGLNEKGYIVPGGGGFGEIMNNSFV
ncbi:MAG: uracil phosphoribosyltransferase [Pseudobdellovibrionaceae bacterium]|jgi:uracil phosphoribosyltransferase